MAIKYPFIFNAAYCSSCLMLYDSLEIFYIERLAATIVYFFMQCSAHFLLSKKKKTFSGWVARKEAVIPGSGPYKTLCLG